MRDEYINRSFGLVAVGFDDFAGASEELGTSYIHRVSW